MKTSKLAFLLFSLFLLNACSDDKSSSTSTSSSAAKAKAPEKKHVEHGEANDTAKYKFEKAFAAKCVERELHNSINPDSDRPRLEENCGCISRHISEDLSDVDAEKYLEAHEDTHALQIKFDAAAYFCLQNKPQPKGMHLFGRQPK